jgi:pyridoxine 5-phosphate synthase
MPKLGVNVDHIATIRQARKAGEPDPVAAAILAELAGADGITVHLRADRRHIQDRDVRVLREAVKTKLNLEMAATQEMIKIAFTLKPDVSTLVPERREEVTTEGGLDILLNESHLRKAVRALKEAGVEVSIFVDPDSQQIKAAQQIEADAVEINTGAYAEANREKERMEELEKIQNSARFASKMGLKVLAGHGLNYRNVAPIARIREIEELNIGHSIVARASLVGMERAVREMKALLEA